jgi:hypothetical protein
MSHLKRLLGPLLTIALLVGVGLAIYQSAREQIGVETVRGLIGSEKEDFFLDPRVIETFRSGGFDVQIQKAGSREIATLPTLREFDFAFPAGMPAAEKIRREQNIAKSYPVFFTPMAVASWKLIAGILTANGVVSQRDGIYYIIDMNKLLGLSEQRMRWNQLVRNEGYAVNKSILMSTTDVRSSNSAAMYLALASYVLNGSEIVSSDAQANALTPRLRELFSRQGYQESTSAMPFNDYLVMGPGKAPLVMIYEAQYLAEAARADSGLNDEMVLMYPEPTLFTKHIVVPLTAKGDRFSEFLTRSPALQRLAVEHGFRNSDNKNFQDFLASHRLTVPATLVDVIEPPSYEILEGMISRIEQSMSGADRP